MISPSYEVLGVFVVLAVGLSYLVSASVIGLHLFRLMRSAREVSHFEAMRLCSPSRTRLRKMTVALVARCPWVDWFAPAVVLAFVPVGVLHRVYVTVVPGAIMAPSTLTLLGVLAAMAGVSAAILVASFRASQALARVAVRAPFERDEVAEARRQYEMLIDTVSQAPGLMFGRWDENGHLTVNLGGALDDLGNGKMEDLGSPVQAGFEGWGVLDEFNRVFLDGEERVNYAAEQEVENDKGREVRYMRGQLVRNAIRGSEPGQGWAGYYVFTDVTDETLRQHALEGARDAAQEDATRARRGAALEVLREAASQGSNEG